LDVSTILNALGQDIADNKGVFDGVCSTTIPSTPTHIGTTVSLVDLPCSVLTCIPSAFPADSQNGTPTDTGYIVAVDTAGRATVRAPSSNEAALGIRDLFV
jgi:hypothetical protein